MTPIQFEDRLLAELRQVVASRPPLPAATARRPRRAPRLLLGGVATAAVAATALVLAAGGDRTAPAFAIERQADGNVTVTIHRLSDADGLERQLRAAGIAAVVDYTPPGKACQQPRGSAPSAPKQGHGAVSGTIVRAHSATFTISRSLVGPGQTVVIMTSGGAGVSSVGMQVVQGRVAPCKLVAAPAPPPDAKTFSTGGGAGGTFTGTERRSLHTGP